MTTHDIPPYPFHLTVEEREAVAEKAARDMVERALSDTPGKATVSLRTVVGMIAPLVVSIRWAGQHVAELERQIKELKNETE